MGATLKIDFDGFFVQAPGEWSDVTSELDAGSPATLALPDGVGALQFSSARYTSGDVPAPTMVVLDAMLREFAAANDLGPPSEQTLYEGALVLAAATFTQPDTLIRVWYVSDGRNLAKVTYTCVVFQGWQEELPDCERIVRSIVWPPRA